MQRKNVWRENERRTDTSVPATKIPPGAVFLVGFMGAGKTSVGRALGQRLNWIFEDLDDRIEQSEGRKIADIFSDSGEPAFRRAERAALEQVLQELYAGSVRIVALGGGAFPQRDNAALLRNSGAPTVFLDAPAEELWERCRLQATKNAAIRPLLQSIEQFRDLHEARRRSYLQASLRVETAGRTVEAIAAEIIEALCLRKMPLKKLPLKELALRIEQGEVE